MIAKYIKDNNKIYEKNNLYNIINGIYESIDIKIANIQERQEEIFCEKDNIYDNIDKELEKLKNYNIEYNFDNIYDILKNDFNIKNIENYINVKDMLCNLEKAFKPYIKKIEAFVKNTILFEISTFQEIMYYSVVRLRQSDDKDIKDFINYIDDVDKNIEKILKNNDILLIKPEPHDMFDAKEHEVLLAEKNEDFLKGQIIKVVNYGYKAKDKGVIKRATIIAAK